MPPRSPVQKAAFVCYRCTRRQLSSSHNVQASNEGYQATTKDASSFGAAHLKQRSLLAVHGQDASHFLQGITTANIPTTSSASDNMNGPSGFYSAFLNAQGRVLHDVFIYPASHSSVYRTSLPSSLTNRHADNDPAYLIEVDATQATTLEAHLKKYKLRAKLSIYSLPDWSIYSSWSSPWTRHASSSDLSTLTALDARAPGMGHRILYPPSATLPASDEKAYLLRRYARGVPEGQSEIPRAAALPQEYNIDFMGGIDFRKGCYVGQELTIRTHHTGIVRKRVLPCVLYPVGVEKASAGTGAWAGVQVPEGTGIVPLGRKGRSAGRWVRGVGEVGLALCRVEMMTDLVLTGETGGYKAEHEFMMRWGAKHEDVAEVMHANAEPVAQEAESEEQSVGVRAVVPDWIRAQVKVKTPNARV